MASTDDDAGSSLFEGMVLFDPADLSPSSPPAPPLPSHPDVTIPEEEELPPPRPPSPHPPVPSSPSAPPSATSQPLDEDLFSDLTLLTPSSPTTVSLPDGAESGASSPLPPPPPQSAVAEAVVAPEIPHPSPPARQISRKKKRAVRVGYAREPAVVSPSPFPATEAAGLPAHEAYGSVRVDDPVPLSAPDSTGLRSEFSEIKEEKRQHLPVHLGSGIHANSHSDHRELQVVESDGNVEDDRNACSPAIHEGNTEDNAPQGKEAVEEMPTLVLPDKGDDFVPTEEKLELIRSQITQKLESIKEMASSVLGERKKLGRRRRKVAEDVNSTSVRYKDLERGLEEACEAEDFERAERISESLAAAEKDNVELLSMLREVEADCDSVDLRLQEVLEMQIAAEEEGMRLLEQFAKDAADNADLVLKDAKEVSSKEMEEWQLSSEALEIRKMEMDVELHLVDEARSGLETSIEQLIQDDKKEKDRLTTIQDVLAKELEELLALVRLKEAEIEENNSQIQEVEKRISNAVHDFQDSRSSIDMKCIGLQSALSRIESEGEALSITKSNICEQLNLAEQKSSKLKELACLSADEARMCSDLAVLRKKLASPILKSREEKVRLVRIEERISEDIQTLKQQISDARASLQELSSYRSNTQEEITSFKQRISFIDKRGPELEAEKKVAAVARNFKEAGRIAAEAKSLNIEKESVQSKLEKAILDSEMVDEKIKNSLNEIEENEQLIVLKERDAAGAVCQRLLLVAAAAKAERLAALRLGDTEEAEVSHQEAEAAESRSRELQQGYDLNIEELGKATGDHISLALITNLAGKQLAEMASSLNSPAVTGS